MLDHQLKKPPDPSDTTEPKASPSGPPPDALERLEQLSLEAGAPQPGESPAAPSRLTESPGGRLDALERLARLNESLRARSTPAARPPEPLQAEPAIGTVRDAHTSGFKPSGRLIKSIVALTVAAALVWVPAQRLLSIRSAQATINARLVNLRAPIDGNVQFIAPQLSVGTLVYPGQPLLRLVNARADHHRLDDLRRKVNGLNIETASLKRRLATLTRTRDALRAQTKAFQQGRIRQLEARESELESEVKAAEAHLEDAVKSFKRSQDLNARGVQTVATLLHAERDMKVAETKVEAARKRRDGNRVELEGARKGFFVGDSYNDVPRSSQRLDEVEQQLADLASRIEESEAQLADFTTDLEAETRLFASNSAADVKATVRGRVWELLTANGEDVRAGQELLRILDCSAAVVTATVSESVYNGLWVGQPVEFRLRGEGTVYAGSVAALTGLTPAGSNLAIEQSALTREPYHVTITVPDLAAREECNVGRTGSVVFKSSPSPGTTGFSAADASAAARKTAIAIEVGRTGRKLAGDAARSAAALSLTARNAIKALKPGLDLR